MHLVRPALAMLCVALTAVLLAGMWPHAREAGHVLAAQDDPARLSDIQLSAVLRNDPEIIARNVEAALADHDTDLADSFVALAQDRRIPLPNDLTDRVAQARADDGSAANVARRFAGGLFTGTADDAAGLTGVLAGDLFVIGDIRDVLREGKHLALGEETDRLVLSLAAAGLAITAATYVSVGGASPLRAGLSFVKDARKVGRIGEGLAAWAGRSAREVVDAPALERAVASGSVLRPGETATAIRAAFRADKADGLVRLAKDVGRVTEKAGSRGAFDALKLAEDPADIARAARLARAEGGRTRAILKILGRGALVLASGAFDLVLWLFSALVALLGFVSSIKAAAESATQACLNRTKARRMRRQMASTNLAQV